MTLRLPLTSVLVTLFTAAACLPAQAQRAAAAQQTPQDVLDVERAWLDAIPARDADTVDRILADEFSITYASGDVSDRAGNMDFVRSAPPPDPSTRLRTEGTTVLMLDDVAILRGIFVHEVGGQTVTRARYTDTYVFRDGRWQVIASQLTRTDA